MKIDINGIVREMTEKEIEEMERQQAEIHEPEMNTDERIKQIEAALIELAGMMAGGDA